MHRGRYLLDFMLLLAHAAAGLHADCRGFLGRSGKLATGAGHLVDGVLEAFCHAVEGLADASQLIGSAVVGAAGQVAVGEPGAGLLQSGDGSADTVNDAPGHQQQYGEGDQGSNSRDYQRVLIAGFGVLVLLLGDGALQLEDLFERACQRAGLRPQRGQQYLVGCGKVRLPQSHKGRHYTLGQHAFKLRIDGVA